MRDEYLDLLKNSIKEVIEKDFKSIEENVNGGMIISGHGLGKGENYELKGVNIFETSIVEKLIINLFKILYDKKQIIGWEASYPHEEWGRSKLDLGLDLIQDLTYLFKIAVEVKKIALYDDDFVPYNVWNDIFKLCGYWVKDRTDVGQDKLVLLFFEMGEYNEEKAVKLLENAFITQETLFNYLNNKVQRNNLNIVKENNIYKDFLINELKWKAGIEHVLYMLDLQKNGPKQFIKIEPINSINKIFIHGKYAAAMLRLIDINSK